MRTDQILSLVCMVGGIVAKPIDPNSSSSIKQERQEANSLDAIAVRDSPAGVSSNASADALGYGNLTAANTVALSNTFDYLHTLGIALGRVGDNPVAVNTSSDIPPPPPNNDTFHMT